MTLHEVPAARRNGVVRVDYADLLSFTTRLFAERGVPADRAHTAADRKSVV